MIESNPFTALAGALRERLSVIADRALYQSDPAAHLQKLNDVSERITRLQTTLPDPVDPQLGHYLARCSYDKALALLESYEPAGFPPARKLGS